jgi:hypothetical protein
MKIENQHAFNVKHSNSLSTNNTMNDKINKFLVELADLLEKHDAELMSADMEPIAVTVGGDYMTAATFPTAATPKDVRNAQLP